VAESEHQCNSSQIMSAGTRSGHLRFRMSAISAFLGVCASSERKWSSCGTHLAGQPAEAACLIDAVEQMSQGSRGARSNTSSAIRRDRELLLVQAEKERYDGRMLLDRISRRSARLRTAPGLVQGSIRRLLVPSVSSNSRAAMQR